MNLPQTRLSNPLLLLLLVSADLVFIFMFGLLGLGVVDDEGFSLIHDRTYSELYQYVKLFWLATCFLLLCAVTKELLYGMFAAVFGFLLLDDYFEIHEHSGVAIADMLSIPDALMLSAHDFGELIVFAVYAVVFVPAFALTYRSASAITRKRAATLIKFVVVIAFFVIVVDVLHSLHLPYFIRHTIGAIEDGGEMIALSGMFWYVYCLANQAMHPQDVPVEMTQVIKAQEPSAPADSVESLVGVASSVNLPEETSERHART